MVARAVLQPQPLNIHSHGIVALRNEQQLTQRGKFIGETRVHEQVERTELKGAGHVVVALNSHIAANIEMQARCDLVWFRSVGDGSGRRGWRRSAAAAGAAGWLLSCCTSFSSSSIRCISFLLIFFCVAA